MNITQVEDPTIDDFYTLSGTDIPPDAVIEFTTAAGTENIKPDFIRPHFALVERLPASIPPGSATVQITSPSTPSSNTLSVTVTNHPPQPVRVLHAGELKPHPYTIAFVANPAIESEFGGFFSPDPVLTNRPGFQAVVTNCFDSLFTLTEDLLRDVDSDARMRFVSVFDPTRPANAANSLAHEVFDSDVMETRRAVLRAFLNTFGITADVVFVIHGSKTHTRASAWYTTDDSALAGTNYTFDGVTRRHGHFARIPGSAAIPISLDTTRPIVIHEFGHAASDFNNGMVIDLSHDFSSEPRFAVNKKFRAVAGSAVPDDFATYEATDFGSDPTRGGLTYPAHWRSFHPMLTGPIRPNLMDDDRLADAPLRCRFDSLTSRWLRDRLKAKLSR